MKKYYLFCFVSLLALCFVDSYGEPINKGGTTNLSIGSIQYSHINTPPVWVIETPDVLEMVRGQHTTSVTIKGIGAGHGIVSCVYWREKYNSVTKMWEVEKALGEEKFFYIDVIDNGSSGDEPNSEPDPGQETGDAITTTHNISLYVGQEYNFQIDFPDEGYGYRPSDSKCLATWTYDTNHFEKISSHSLMKEYGLKAMNAVNSTTVTAKYATRSLDKTGHYVYTNRQENWIVKIKPIDITPQSIAIANDEIELFVDEGIYLNAEVMPNGAPQEFTWVNLNPELVTLSSVYKTGEGTDYDSHPQIYTNYGSVYVKAAPKNSGVARIRVECPFSKVSSRYFTIKVKGRPVQSLSIPQKINIEQGTHYQITPTIEPNGADTKIIWSVEDDTILSIDSFGRITGLKPGTTTVCAEAESGVKATTQVTVLAHRLQLFSSSEGGCVPYMQTVTLTSSREAASIYYTLNGDEPTKQSILYTEPVEIDKTLTLKAKAFLEGYECSETLIRNYQVKLDISANLSSGIVNSGQQLILSCTNPNANIFYTLKGDTPNRNGIRYTSPVFIENSCSVKAVAICDGCTDSDILELDFQLKKIDIVISPQKKLLSSGDVVTINVSPSDAIVRYTTDGIEPTRESQLYSSGISINRTSVLKVYAYRDGYGDTYYEQNFIVLEGDGTSELPYVIKTKDELKEFANNVNKGDNYSGIYFKLGENINLNPGKIITVAANEDVEKWTPIGNEKNVFGGVFDGSGFTISGVCVNQTDGPAGLFGYIKNAKIHNLTIDNSFIKGKQQVGGICGYAELSNIENCINYSTVESEMEEKCRNVGGIVGEFIGSHFSSESCFLKKCINYGNVSAYQYAGGVFGLSRSISIIDCVNYGTVAAYQYAGGICGYVTALKGTYGGVKYVDNCCNYGKVSCSYNGAGGITAYHSGTSGGYTFDNYVKFRNCLNIGECVSTGAGTIIAHDLNGNAVISHCFYLNTSGKYAVGSRTSYQLTACKDEEYLKSISFLNELNSSASSMSKDYSTWIFGEDGFPVLSYVCSERKHVKLTDISTLSDAMYADAATALKGGEGTLTINLKNAQVTSGYSFDLLLPEGVTVDSYTLSSRHNGHSETMNYNATTGVYSFAVLSLQSKELKGNDGAVWILKLKVADGVAAGDYAVSVQNAKYSLTSGSTSVSLPDVTSLLTIEDYKKGDANGDGAADIADAVCIVNHVVGKDTPSYVAAAADANGDGVVDIADAVRVVNLVVGKIDALSRGLKADFGYPEPQ